MDKTTKTITLKSIEYNDYDRLLSLYSLDYGKITVVAKGIRRPKAKLKFLEQSACFADVELVDTNGRLTLKTAQQTESFFSIGSDLQTFYCASTILEILSNCEQEGQPNGQLFLLALKSLSALSTQTCDLLVLTKFVLSYLKIAGYQLDFSECNVCHSTTQARKCYLDLQLGGVVCADCRTPNSILVMPDVKTNLTLVDTMPFEKLKNLAFTPLQQTEGLKLLNGYFSHLLTKLHSLNQLLSL